MNADEKRKAGGPERDAAEYGSTGNQTLALDGNGHGRVDFREPIETGKSGKPEKQNQMNADQEA
jgi:hypothetical protein